MSKHYHGTFNHNKWIRKGYPCPYCIKGSKPVPEAMLSMTDTEIELTLKDKVNQNEKDSKK